jgi:hypothetical protein
MARTQNYGIIDNSPEKKKKRIFLVISYSIGSSQIEVPEVSQSEEGQRQKLRIIVDALERILHEQGAGSSASQQPGGQPKWTAEMIHQKVFYTSNISGVFF